MKSENILFLSDVDAGGEWIATQTLIEEIRKTTTSVKIFLIGRSIKKRPPLVKTELFDHIEIIHPKTFPKPFKYYRQWLAEIRQISQAVNRLYRLKQIDRVVISYYLSGLGYLVGRKRLDYFFYFHGIRNRFKVTPQNFNHFMFLNKLGEKLVWRMAKVVISPSNSALGYFPKGKLLVLPNLARKEFFESKKDGRIDGWIKNNHLGNKKIIIYSGRIAEKKGVYKLVQAFNKLDNRDGKLVLVFCYVESGSKEEKDFVNEYKNNERILFIKDLGASQLSRLYHHSSLGVLPSEFEIDPLFYLESLAAGLPIIATKTGTVKKINSSLLIKNNSESEIYKKIKTYFKKELLYRRIFKQEAIKLKQNYHPQTAVKRFLWILKI